MTPMGKKKETGFFLKIYKNIVLLSICLLITLAGVFYLTFQNYSLNQIFDFNKALLEETSENIEKINLNTTYYVKSVFQNISAQRLMYTRNGELNELIRDIQAVEKMLASNPYVHSIYIYNPEIDTFYIFGAKDTLIREGQIYDSGVIDLLYDGKAAANYPIPRKIPDSENKPSEIVNIYSYLLKGEKESETQMPYGVIINIHSEILFHDPGSLENNVFIPGRAYSVDSLGEISGSSDPAVFGKNIGQEDYFKRVIGEADRSGYFISCSLSKSIYQ